MDTFRIKTLLDQNAMTFSELSDIIGVSRTNLYNYIGNSSEVATTNNTIIILKKVAEALNVNVSDLFSKSDTEIVHGYLEIQGNNNDIFIINNILDLQRFNAMLEDYLIRKNNNQAE